MFALKLFSLLCVVHFVASDDFEKTKTGYKILVTNPEVPQKGLEILRNSGAEVIVVESLPPKRSELLEKAKGVHALYWASHEPLNGEVLDVAGPQLKSVSTMSAGFDYVDVEELKKRNIPLGHTPEVVNNGVANQAMGLMISAGRRFREGRQKIENSEWENFHPQWMLGQDISGATVGFFGFGRIGKTIAKRLTSFDVERILYTTRHRVDEEIEQKFNASKASFDDMLSQSDFVFIATPLTPETQGVFNSSAFGKMKKNAVLINIARGPIVNQDDLYEALKSKQIFAAGIDVMYPEPLPANHKLLTLPNLIITPHTATSTLKTRTAMAVVAAQNVLRGLNGEKMVASAY